MNADEVERIMAKSTEKYTSSTITSGGAHEAGDCTG